MKLPAYLQAVIALRPTELKPGEVVDIFVCHDDWCPKLKGGECGCSFVVRAEDPLNPRKEV